jgi:SAM-dependent methyltransferase
MKKTIAEHAERFDRKAPDYDDDTTPEYRACADLVVEHASPRPDDLVLDLGTGTGAIALALAESAGHVVGRDVSEGMLARAREKASDRGLDDRTDFGEGRFREPAVEAYRPPADEEWSERTVRGSAFDVVVSNFAMHHLSDEEKAAAIDVVADLDPRRFVLGDLALFAEPDPEEPFFDPSVDDPARVGVLADLLTDRFDLVAVERVHPAVGVLVAERP